MRIEIWSDVVCPWCYIGKRRLEAAIDRFVAEPGRSRKDIEVVFRSFQLDPASPVVVTESVAEHLGRKYGGGVTGGQQMIDQVEAVAAEEGLVFRLGRAHRVGTRDAHRLLHEALIQGGPGQQRAHKEELLTAYFVQAENVADHATLRRTATRAGLDAEAVDRVLESDLHDEAVEADIREAAALGASGVPFFVIDRAIGVAGAQSVDTFVQVLDQAWARRRPEDAPEDAPEDVREPASVPPGAPGCGPEACCD